MGTLGEPCASSQLPEGRFQLSVETAEPSVLMGGGDGRAGRAWDR